MLLAIPWPRTAAVVLAGVAAAAGAAPVARAGWTAPRMFTTADTRGGVPLVDGRGDVALIWEDGARSLHVVTAPVGGPARTSVLARGARGETGVIDERGRVTVAWTAGGQLRAAYASRTGRWSAPQRIAGAQAVSPALAVSPGGRVLLGWVNDVASGDPTKATTGVAWSRPGHPFASAKTLGRPRPTLMPGELPSSRTGVAFDAAGVGYVWDSCAGDVRRSAPGATSFELAAVGPPQALGFSLAVAGRRSGLAGWIDSRCTSDPAAGAAPGPVRARVLRGGSFAAPLTLTDAAAGEQAMGQTQAIALAGDGGYVDWTPLERFPTTRGVPFATDGSAGSAFDWPAGAEPMTADGGGDLVLADPIAGYRVRRADGGEDPFDLPHPSIWAGNLAAPAAAAHGRAFAAAWDPDLAAGPDHHINDRWRTSVSVWRP